MLKRLHLDVLTEVKHVLIGPLARCVGVYGLSGRVVLAPTKLFATPCTGTPPAYTPAIGKVAVQVR